MPVWKKMLAGFSPEVEKILAAIPLGRKPPGVGKYHPQEPVLLTGEGSGFKLMLSPARAFGIVSLSNLQIYILPKTLKSILRREQEKLPDYQDAWKN